MKNHKSKLSGIGIQFFAAPSARMGEIESRLAAIAQELERDDCDVDALEREARALKEERDTLTRSAERRRQLLSEIGAGRTGRVTHTFEDGTPEQRTYGVDTPEYRSAWLRNLQGRDLSAEERAAVTATAAIPTTTMNKIIARMELTPIIQAVDVTYIPGNVTYPIEKTVNGVSWVDMGTAATDSADALDAVTLGAYKLIKTVEITADVMAMGIDAFEDWLVARLGNKMSVAVAAAIAAGTGSNQATGLTKSGEITQTGTYTKAGMTYKDLMTLLATLPTQYMANAKFAMPRAVFYSDLLGMTDSNGKPVVVADVQSPAKFNILGYPVILEDSIPKDNIVFGDLFEGYKFNFAMAPTVESDKSVAFRSGSTVYRVMALADGKPADKKALCLFTRAAS